MGGKSQTVSTAALNRLKNISAPAISLTYVNLLRVEPTSNDGPTGWVEWGVIDDPTPGTAVDRIRIFATDPSDGTPYWSPPAADGEDANKIEIHNINGVRWSSVSLPETTVVLALGVFKTASSTYEEDSATGKAKVVDDDKGDLLYWNTLDTTQSVTNGETVLFLSTKIKVTEQ